MKVTTNPRKKKVMSRFKSDFLRTLDERGFIHQISDEAGLDELFAKETVTAYIGYDPTAPSFTRVASFRS